MKYLKRAEEPALLTYRGVAENLARKTVAEHEEGCSDARLVRPTENAQVRYLPAWMTERLTRLRQGAAHPAKRLGHALGRAYIRKVTRDDYRHQKVPCRNERAIEYRFLFDCLIRTGAETVLDVGTGNTALPHALRTCGCHVTAIDNIADFWPRGMINRHWYVLDDDIRKPKVTGPFDLVACISVIEHIADHLSAIEGMVGLLAPHGHLVLTTPYTEQRTVSNVYAEPGAAYGQDAPYICRSSSRQELTQWLGTTGAEIVVQEYWRFWTGPFWTQGERYLVPEQVTAHEPHQLACFLLRRGSIPRPEQEIGNAKFSPGTG
jgi:2-polyprenyl-3-methyl-5-hydroxy-6-metoxy-1,4-benzoquinol methylase